MFTDLSLFNYLDQNRELHFMKEFMANLFYFFIHLKMLILLLELVFKGSHLLNLLYFISLGNKIPCYYTFIIFSIKTLLHSNFHDSFSYLTINIPRHSLETTELMIFLGLLIMTQIEILFYLRLEM